MNGAPVRTRLKWKSAGQGGAACRNRTDDLFITRTPEAQARPGQFVKLPAQSGGEWRADPPTPELWGHIVGTSNVDSAPRRRGEHRRPGPPRNRTLLAVVAAGLAAFVVAALV